MTLAHTLDKQRREQRRDRRNQGNRDATGPIFSARAHFVGQLFDLPQNVFAVAKQPGARLGQLHPATVPAQQQDAKIFFQFPELAAQCRLGDMEVIGRLAYAFEGCGRHEIPEGSDIHSHLLPNTARYANKA